MTSSQWKSYFEENAHSLLDVPWEVGGDLRPEESAAIRASLRAFQAGEISEGQHLYRYAKEHAAKTGDDSYVAAIRLFIAEEQRHARDLARFLKLNDIALVRTTFTDFVFRRLRHLFRGLEVSVAVLVTAEIIAEVYYAALREATQSAVLRRSCDQILRDEVKHVQFQVDSLRTFRRRRGGLAASCTMTVQRFLFMGTTMWVGLIHLRALSRGGYGLRRWWQCCWERFGCAFAGPQQPLAPAAAPPPPPPPPP